MNELNFITNNFKNRQLEESTLQFLNDQNKVQTVEHYY